MYSISPGLSRVRRLPNGCPRGCNSATNTGHPPNSMCGSKRQLPEHPASAARPAQELLLKAFAFGCCCFGFRVTGPYVFVEHARHGGTTQSASCHTSRVTPLSMMFSGHRAAQPGYQKALLRVKRVFASRSKPRTLNP